ncbi:hypothetical protein ACFL7D_07475 [candidate division KSB1 bacterium]
MKPIRYILQTYFQQEFNGMLIFVLSIIVFIATNITDFSGSETGMEREVKTGVLFLVALCGIVINMADHLKRLIRSNASILIPNYRKYQLYTAGLILLIFLGWPLYIIAVRDYGFFNHFALYIASTAYLLWIFFTFGAHIANFLAIIWGVRFFYEILGFPVEINVFGFIVDYQLFGHPYMFYCLIILISLAAMAYFVYRYIRNTSFAFTNGENDTTDPYLRDFDRVDRFTARAARKSIKQLIKVKDKEDPAGSYFSRLVQFSLFNPAFLVFSISSLMVLVIFGYMGSVFFLITDDLTKELNYIFLYLVLLFYGISISMLATDFLLHRKILAEMWLRSMLISRTEFTKSVAFIYLIIALKQYLFNSVIFALIIWIIPNFFVKDFLQFFVLGFQVIIVVYAFSLIFSDDIRSENCRGWTLSSIFSLIIVFALVLPARDFFNNSVESWIAIVCISAVAGFLYNHAINVWKNTELDFAGPEMPA